MLLEFLKAALSAIPSAAVNGYALCAYALAIAAYVFTVWRVARNKNLLANIEKLPAKDRLKTFEIEVGGVRLAKGISPEQWVRSRIHRYYLLAFLATCAVVVAVAALAMLNGAKVVQGLTVINNEYVQISNGVPLSSADLQRVEQLLNALVSRDRETARTAFNQLSEPARSAYQRAYPSAKELLVPAQELSEGPAPASTSGQPTARGRDPRPASGEPAAPSRQVVVPRETEPNHDILHAQQIPLNTTISALIDGPSGVDFFTINLGGAKRDYIDIVVSNQSTALAPRITVYKADKGVLDGNYNSTPGGDVSFSFVAPPDSRFYVSVSSYSGSDSSRGGYQLTVRPRNAFDGYEPNDDILSASSIEVGRTIEANIMDVGDIDYYRFDTGNSAKLVASLDNRSTALAPRITVYKPDKGALDGNYNPTPGGDVSYSFAVQPNSRYYLSVSSYSGSSASSGKYALTVRPE